MLTSSARAYRHHISFASAIGSSSWPRSPASYHGGRPCRRRRPFLLAASLSRSAQLSHRLSAHDRRRRAFATRHSASFSHWPYRRAAVKISSLPSVFVEVKLVRHGRVGSLHWRVAFDRRATHDRPARFAFVDMRPNIARSLRAATMPHGAAHDFSAYLRMPSASREARRGPETGRFIIVICLYQRHHSAASPPAIAIGTSSRRRARWR